MVWWWLLMCGYRKKKKKNEKYEKKEEKMSCFSLLCPSCFCIKILLCISLCPPPSVTHTLLDYHPVIVVAYTHFIVAPGFLWWCCILVSYIQSYSKSIQRTIQDIHKQLWNCWSWGVVEALCVLYCVIFFFYFAVLFVVVWFDYVYCIYMLIEIYFFCSRKSNVITNYIHFLFQKSVCL